MDFKRKNKTNEEIELLEKSTLYGKPKDVKKGGYTCKNDSGGGLVIKRGKRFVIIGEFVCLSSGHQGDVMSLRNECNIYHLLLTCTQRPSRPIIFWKSIFSLHEEAMPYRGLFN